MILTFLEHDAGEIAPTSREALAFAAALAAEGGAPLHAVVVGDDGHTVAAEVTGVDVLHVIALEGAFAPAAWALSLTEVMRALTPRAVVAPGTTRGNEMLAHVGAIAALPMVANCVEASLARGVVTRQRWGGALLEEARVVGDDTLLLTVAPHVVEAPDENGSREPAVTVHVAAPDDGGVRLARVEPSGDGGVALGRARVVVGGGRGVGSAEGFACLDELAALLGGAVGVSRAVTSAGWRPHREQIGQTGTKIAPDVYIACGVSGASQHMIGCAGAKRIVAINTDPDAPIVARADHVVLGDLHTVVPAIVEELRRRKEA
jgi:electron transfer flavoprotein alpha subunit